MGDEAKTNRRKPLSLNDRHYRFLLDLSAPPKPTAAAAAAAAPSSSSASGEEVNPPKARLEGRRRLCKASTSSLSATETEGYGGGCGDDEDDGPQFGLADFNSPLEDEVQKKLNVNLEGSKEDVCKVLTGEPKSSGDDANPHFSGIVNFDCPDAEEEEKRSTVNPEGLQDPLKDLAKETLDNGDDDIQKFSGRIDSASPEEKLRMVKVVGRRRLCKLSSQEHDNAGTGALDDGVLDFNDFDSPFPSQTRGGDGVSNPGVGEIRDILNDLTSRLGLLSIEKSKVPRDMKTNGDELMGYVQDGGQDKVDAPEYASAGSSFSSRSNPSNSSSDETKGVIKDFENAVYEFNQANNLLSGAEDDYFGDKVHDSKTNEGLRRNECARLDGELISVGKSCVSDIEEEQCSIQSGSDGDDYFTRAQRAKKSTLRSNNDDPKRVHEKLRYAGRSYLHLLRDQDEEDEDEQDDCVVLSGKNVVKETGTHAVRHKQYPDPSGVIDVLDDETDKSVLEDGGVFTLSGLKLSYKLPGKIANMLYPHQREGLKWLWSLHCQGKGGILGDDMGLGKTMQICGFLAGLFHSRLIRRALVVAPKTLLPHWIKELSAVGLSGKTREYFGTSIKAREYELKYIFQDKGVLLTTYDIVRNNSKSLQGNHFFADEDCEGGFPWDYMILDEGHLIKNPSTQRAKSLLEIPCAHRIIISGTPIQNNLKELWALFNFCCPDLLGDKKWFKDRFENPILRGNEKNASDRDKRIGSTVAKELRERIEPYFLRRLKNEVFKGDDDTTVKLSKKNEFIVWLKLTSCQRQLYEAFLQSEIVLSAFDGSPLAALTILKKICDHPLLLTRRAAEDVLEGMDSILNPEDAGIAEKLAMHVADVTQEANFEENHDNVSCKISFILSLLDNLIPEGHKVLIFSQTRKMLNLIQESLLSSGYEFLRIDGTTKAIDRVKIVDDFQKGNGPPIFLLTSQVGGLGLTLTEADRVIVVDPAWNPSTDNQSVDRAYRIGQKKDVIVYRLMTCGTVEEKIYRKQIFKGGLFKTATEHKEQIRYFSQQDLRELFSLPKQGFDVSLTQQQLHEEHDGRHKMDEALETHIKFLETRGIAGVSHHSLLFSKTAPEQVVHEEEEEIRRKPTTTFVRNSSSSYFVERDIDAAVHAFKPKDVQLNRKVSSPDSVGKLTESDIKERINRLSQILSNKATVSRLPDGGAKLQKQISELNSELCKMKEKENVKQVIELDDLAGELQRALNV